jgi:hypothetical protein
MKERPQSPTPDSDSGESDRAAPPHPMSSARPMSDEERAALEEVYRDRGCGAECDC